MSGRPVWKVSVRTTPELDERVAESLQRAFGRPASSYTDLATGATWVSAYLDQRPRGFEVKKEALRNELQKLNPLRSKIGAARILLSRLRHENWAEAWKRHFKPIDLGPALLIRPSWSRRRARPGQRVVILDPGLSFGTGQHPTTRFCLQQIVAHRVPSRSQSCLDLGTGSGILALAAAKLGYGPIEALDHDPEAIRAARANAKHNHLSGRVRFRLQDLTRWPARSPHRYSLVCANLLTPLLVSLRPLILKRLAPDGLLVLAGILRSEFPLVRAAYENAGLRVVSSQAEHEWKSAAIAWGSPRGSHHPAVY